MRFAATEWLWGTAFALLVAGVLVIQGVRLARDRRTFGNPALIEGLITARTSLRRTLRGILVTLAVALAAVAAAGPQYGKGTRVLPATNLDVVLVLDYSKSMYARDVSPSRTERAKIEVARLIDELAGARFGAVAFAGETMSFPLTSDGAAIAQFFRGLAPADMPVGGTGIARALSAGHQLLARDPLSRNHERVIVLVTDGEDLEGDPVAAAEAIAADGVQVWAVQIGGRSPEPIPDIDDEGRDRGLRRNRQGEIMTTQLSPEGEAQLRQIAQAGGGELVMAAKGQVGIDTITGRLRKLMTEELTERVETVYADVYHFPLSAMVVLLTLEALIGLAPRRRPRVEPPRGQRRRRRLRRMQQAAVLLIPWSLGCQPFDQLFERNSPVVDEAIAALETEQRERAVELLAEYLETGPCEAGVIGAGARARARGDAALDLALALAGPYPQPRETEDAAEGRGAAKGPPATAGAKDTVAPAPDPLGNLFGQSPPNPGAPTPAPPGAPPGEAPQVDPELSSRIDCALRVLSPLAENPDHSAALRGRALYLMGNLELRRGKFEEAIAQYDRALLFTPGLDAAESTAGGPPKGTPAEHSPKNGEPGTEQAQRKDEPGDPIGIDIARNRALAQRLKEAKEAQEQQNEQNQSQESQDQDQDGQEPQADQDGDPDKTGDDEQTPQDQKDGDQEDGDQKDDPSEQPGDEQQDPSAEQKNPDDSGDPSASDQERTAEQQPQGDAQQGPDGAARDATKGPAASQDARILDRLEQAPTLQQHDAKRRAATIRMQPTMEDK